MKHEISELDRSLVTALQTYPRAGWAQLAPILHTSASTLSRRWDALTDAGLVWSSALTAVLDRPMSVQAGMVEIRCVTGMRERVITELVAMSDVYSVVACAGAQDLVCMVFAESLYAVDRFVNEHIIVVDGVAQALVNFVSGISVEGSEFRLGSLSDQQIRAVSALRPARSSSAAAPNSAQIEIARHLARDARRSAADIARITGHSHAHVQRQIALMQSATWFMPRIDFSVTDFGLTAVYFWLDCPVDEEAKLASFVRRSPGVRLALPIVARSNLLLSVWLPGLDQISDFERDLVKHIPRVTVVDRWPQISARKRLGVPLDSRGRYSAEAKKLVDHKTFEHPPAILEHLHKM